MSLEIEALTAVAVQAHRAALVALLRDAVDSGASIGFLPPIAETEAARYWDAVAAAIEEGSRVRSRRPRPGARARGLGSAAISPRARTPGTGPRWQRSWSTVAPVAGASGARSCWRSKSTPANSGARRSSSTRGRATRRKALYRSVGWTFAGAIPRYARSATGAFDATALYFKLLDPAR